MFFGTPAWNPLLIIAQILTVQSIFYLTFGLALWILVGPYVSGHLLLVHFFGSSWLDFRSFLGWMAILATIGNSIPVSITILYVIERAKKCLDFAATVYILHLGTACAVFGFPKSAAWWLANSLAFVITAVLSEWLCLRRELRDIPLGGGISRKRSESLSLTELIPLTSVATTPSNTTNRSTSAESTLFGRLQAKFEGSRTPTARDSITLAEEV